MFRTVIVSKKFAHAKSHLKTAENSWIPFKEYKPYKNYLCPGIKTFLLGLMYFCIVIVT